MTLVNRKDDKPIIWPDSSQIDPISNLLLSKTLQELDSNFYKLCEKYAITQFCLVSIYTTPSLQKKMDCFDTYPNGWIKHYESKQYYLYDPVFSQFGTFHFPFPWSLDSLSKIEQTPIQKTFLSEAYNHNIQKGITFPFSPRLSDQNFLTILDHSKLHPEILPILSIAADTYCKHKKTLKNRERLSLLTEREREVLHYKTKQLSLQEISSILKISPATINFHIQKICKKLNAVSLHQALFLFGKMQEGDHSQTSVM